MSFGVWGGVFEGGNRIGRGGAYNRVFFWFGGKRIIFPHHTLIFIIHSPLPPPPLFLGGRGGEEWNQKNPKRTWEQSFSLSFPLMFLGGFFVFFLARDLGVWGKAN